MSFGRREQYDRRNEPRSEILKRASVIFGDKETRASGLIRNISLSGLKFISDKPLDLPRNVTLDFGNGETFPCEVVRETGRLEFGLKFVEMTDFARSDAKENIDAIYQFTKSRTPLEIFDMMEKFDFFGDEELETAMREYAAAYDRMIQLYRERIFAQQPQIKAAG
jgi:hypothetical protein